MPYRQAKFCIDLDRIRWTLLEGVITRKEPNDGPAEGKELPIQQVTTVEKRTVKRVQRSRLGWPLTVSAIGILALSWWTATIFWVASIPGFVIGLVFLYWGARRMASRTRLLDAHQIVAPGTKAEEWLVIGSIPEVLGFIEGVQIELKEKEKSESAPLGN